MVQGPQIDYPHSRNSIDDKTEIALPAGAIIWRTSFGNISTSRCIDNGSKLFFSKTVKISKREFCKVSFAERQ